MVSGEDSNHSRAKFKLLQLPGNRHVHVHTYLFGGNYAYIGLEKRESAIFLTIRNDDESIWDLGKLLCICSTLLAAPRFLRGVFNLWAIEKNGRIDRK